MKCVHAYQLSTYILYIHRCVSKTNIKHSDKYSPVFVCKHRQINFRVVNISGTKITPKKCAYKHVIEERRLVHGTST